MGTRSAPNASRRSCSAPDSASGAGSRQASEPFFLLLHVGETRVPSEFELAGHRPVRRVDGVVLAARQVRFYTPAVTMMSCIHR